MKTILLVVGRTVEQHYITAINDYIQRTKRYITFDMEDEKTSACRNDRFASFYLVAYGARDTGRSDYGI